MHSLWISLQPATASDGAPDHSRSIWSTQPRALPKPAAVDARSSPARRYGRRTPSAQLKLDARAGPIVVDCVEMPKGGSGAKTKPDETRLELGHGIIHLYRESDAPRAPADPFAPSTSKDGGGGATEDDADGLVVAVLAIPSVLSVADFLLFVEPAVDSISQIRILRCVEAARECPEASRDATPHRCMALVKLRTLQQVLDFRENFNGKPFAAMLDVRQLESSCARSRPSDAPTLGRDMLISSYVLTAAQDEICRVVRVRSIEVSSNEAPTFALPYGGSLSGPSTSSAGVVELPLCPVCLERLDANASGLVTIYCQHTLYILSAEALLTAQSLPLP